MTFGKKFKTLLNSIPRSKKNGVFTRDHEGTKDHQDEGYDQYTSSLDNFNDNQGTSDDEEIYEIEIKPSADFRSQPHEFEDSESEDDLETLARRYNVDEFDSPQNQNQNDFTNPQIYHRSQDQNASTSSQIYHQSQYPNAFNNPDPFRDNSNVLSSNGHGLSEDEQIALAITRSLNEIASVITRSLSNMRSKKTQSQSQLNVTDTNPFRNKIQDMNSYSDKSQVMNSYLNKSLPPPPYDERSNNYPSEKSNNFHSRSPGHPRSSTRNPPMMQNWINLPDQTPRDFKILLLGGTGTGKSTIINTITNYFLRGTPDNPNIVIPTKYHKVTEEGFINKHSEAKVGDVTRSQTTKCHKYAFRHPQNPAYRFIFIDTPGLSDTNGTKQDDKNISEIVDTAIRAGSLSALVIIVNGTEARVTNSVKNTLVRLANNLPDVLVDKNLLLILTKCSKSSACFSIPSFSEEITTPKKVFYMDNQAFGTDPQIWKNDFEERKLVQIHWSQSFRTIDDLLRTITELSNTSTDAFKRMKALRDKIKTEITKITQDIANIQQVQDALDAAQQALQVTGDQKNSFANYTKTENITLKKIVPASYHSTVCVTHLREDIICHDHCGLEFKDTSDTSHFRHCACMGDDVMCTECGCGPQSHVHEKVQLITETKTINKVLQDMKAQYDMAEQEHQRIDQDAKDYHETLAKLQATADDKYKQIHQLCYDLSKVCSRFNFVDELHANIENMRQDARAMQNANMRKKAEAEIRKIEKLANDLSTKRNRK
ncbi:7482_t:CDS:2 [Acaulospora morrowiae]|uniref:7482_t:CDS:1 n=1 Tax=Acaulospora morrowiae TaxID=94023 RepID=A0A9N9FQS3_9GLOM|nr:7482_t:CDS:2 [Acaulospora morrowiae]